MATFNIAIAVKMLGQQAVVSGIQGIGQSSSASVSAHEKLLQVLGKTGSAGGGLNVLTKTLAEVREMARQAGGAYSQNINQINQLSEAASASVAAFAQRNRVLLEDLAIERQGAEVSAKFRQEKALLAQAAAAGIDPESRLGQAYIAQIQLSEQLVAQTRAVIESRELAARVAAEQAEAEATLQASIARTMAELEAENAAMVRRIEAATAGLEAYEQQTREEEVLAKVRAAGVEISSVVGEQLAGEIRKRLELAEAIRLQESALKGEGRSEATSLLKKVSPEAGGLASELAHGATPALLALTVVAGTVKELIHGSLEEVGKAQKAFAQLEASVTATGGAAGYSARQMVDMSESLSRISGVDEKLIQGGESVLLTFTHIGHDLFPRVSLAALDISAKFGIDLPAAMQKLGKAMDSPLTGGKALQKMLGTMPVSLQETIKHYVQLGETEKAQGALLDWINGKVQGSAAAFRATLPGAFSALKVEWDHLLQVMGESGLSTLLQYEVEGAIVAIRKLQEWWKLMELGFVASVAVVAQAWAGLVRVTLDGASKLIHIYAELEQHNPFDSDNEKSLSKGQAVMFDAWARQVKADAQTTAEEWRKKMIDMALGVDELSDHLQKGAATGREYTADQVKALEELQKKLAEIRQKTISAGALAGAAALGPEQYRVTVVAQEAENAVLQLRLPLLEKGLDLSRKQVAWIKDQITQQHAFNDLAQSELAIWQERQSTKDSRLMDAAKVKDAISGTSEASLEMTARLEAEGKARANNRQGDAAYVAALKTEILTRLQGNQATEITIRGFDRERQLKIASKTLEAQVKDAKTGNTRATRDLEVALEAENIVLQNKKKLSADEYAQLLKTIDLEHRQHDAKQGEIDDLLAERAAKEKVAGINAQLADSQQFRGAVKAFGSDVAQILQQYGLLSFASDALAQKQEVLNRAAKQHLDLVTTEKGVLTATNKDDLFALIALENKIDLEAKAVKGAKEYAAAVAIAAQKTEALKAPWIELGGQIKSTLITDLANAGAGMQVEWKSVLQDMWRSFLETSLKAIDQWLARWIQAQIQAQAASATTAAVNAAANQGGNSGGGGGGLSGIGSLFGGSGGVPAGGVTGNSWGTTFVTGPGGGASTSGAAAAVGAGATIAIFVAVYAIAKNWLDHHQREFEQIRINAGGLGSLGSSLGGMKAGADHLGAVANDMIKTVAGIVHDLGAVIEGWTGDLTVSRSGHGKSTQYWVQFANGLIQKFGNDGEAAVQFAIVQALRQSDLGGLPAEVRAAIQHSAAQTVDQIKSEIAQAYEDVAARLGNVGQQVYDVFRKYASSITDRIKQAFTELQADLIASKPGGSGVGSGGGGFGSYTKAEVNATSEDVKAVTDLIAARNREVQSIEDSLIGVDDSGAKRLADIASFNKGYEESRNLVNAQIQLVQQELASLGDKGGEAADHLRSVLNQYLAELNKIPEAISGQKLDMAVFNVFDQLLPHTRKYDQERIKFAKMEAEYKLQELKLELIGLGIWEQWASTWQDAYNEAMRLAGKPQGSAGGGQRQQNHDTFEQRLAELRQGAMTDAGRALSQFQADLKAFRDEANKGKATAAERAEGERLLREQLKKTLNEAIKPWTSDYGKTDFQKQLAAARQQVADLWAIPKSDRTKDGLPDWKLKTADANILVSFTAQVDTAVASFRGLSGGLGDIQRQAQDLTANVLSLGLNADDTAKRLAQISLGAAFQVQQGQIGVLDRLYGYLKGSAAHAAQIEAFERSKINLDFQLLRAQLQVWDLWNKDTQGLFADAYALAIAGAHDDAYAAQQQAASSFDSSAQTQSDAANQQKQNADRFRQATDNLIKYSQSFLADAQVSFLNPREQVAASKSTVDGVARAALAGSLDAREQYQQAMQDYLTKFQEIYGRGDAYFAEARGYYDTLQQLIGQKSYNVEGVTYGAFGPSTGGSPSNAGLGYAPSGVMPAAPPLTPAGASLPGPGGVDAVKLQEALRDLMDSSSVQVGKDLLKTLGYSTQQIQQFVDWAKTQGPSGDAKPSTISPDDLTKTMKTVSDSIERLTEKQGAGTDAITKALGSVADRLEKILQQVGVDVAKGTQYAKAGAQDSTLDRVASELEDLGSDLRRLLAKVAA